MQKFTKRLMVILALVTILTWSGLALAHPSYNSSYNLRANGGPEYGLIKLNLSNLNGILEKQGYAPLNDLVPVSGGGGIGGSRSELRVGGCGLGGEVMSYSSEDKTAKLSTGWGGFVFENGVYVERGLDIALGGLLGWGRANLELTDELGNRERNGSNFGLIAPRLNVHQQINSFAGMELIAMYVFTYKSNSTWKIGGESVACPLNNAAGPYIGVRVSFGF